MRTAHTREIGLAAVLALGLAAGAQGAGPYVDGTFRGRIAYSADGNHNDPDDWAASPMVLAILAECGLRERLVHFHYNCILPQTDPRWEAIHAQSVLEAADHWGYDRKRFFDCRQALDAAVRDLAAAIDASTADDPLYLIIAGPVEVPLQALQRAGPAQREHVYCISHSRWNDGYARRYSFRFTKRAVIELGVPWVQIQDQNARLSTSPYGQPARPEHWMPWHWLRDSPDPKLQFLWQRMEVSTRPDPSDAGMAYFLATGDETADPEKLRRLLAEHQRPVPLAARSVIRLEAENFRVLEGWQIDSDAPREVSHRLHLVRQADRPTAHAMTRLREPYMADRAVYDLVVRYGQAGKPAEPGGSPWELTIEDPHAGRQVHRWSPPDAAEGWISHTLPGVTLSQGATLKLTTTAPAARWDYLELRRREQP
jgi:hypothetical protein